MLLPLVLKITEKSKNTATIYSQSTMRQYSKKPSSFISNDMASSLAKPGPGLRHVLKTIRGSVGVKHSTPGATTEQAERFLKETTKWEKFFTENSTAPRTHEINWNLYTARLGPEVVNEVKGVYEKALENLRQTCTARVMEIENTEVKKMAEEAEVVVSVYNFFQMRLLDRYEFHISRKRRPLKRK